MGCLNQSFPRSGRLWLVGHCIRPYHSQLLHQATQEEASCLGVVSRNIQRRARRVRGSRCRTSTDYTIAAVESLVLVYYNLLYEKLISIDLDASLCSSPASIRQEIHYTREYIDNDVIPINYTTHT
ncbi:hypothetical protein VTN77DRAFT_940 [Rasamsonia byssochlamydoides]|uniref:uncharacterized protein n=1 Tax=Rasamsonia byssochlamydoides TaxID=89139 RepID=UPI003743C19C